MHRISVMMVISCTLLAACSPGTAGEERAGRGRDRGTPEAGYIVAQPQRVDLTTDLPGRTTAFEVSEVRPQVTGVILARRFTEGAVVQAGQTLYQIDPALYDASAEQAQANLAAAQASQTAAQSRATRLEPLIRINAVSRQEFTDAVAGAQQSRASVAQNRAMLKTARINLRYTRVPAPISGRVGRSTVTTGALVTANQTTPMTVIQRLDPIYVDIQQSSAALLTLRRSLDAAGGDADHASAAVRLTLADGTDYPMVGQVQFAEATVDPSTGAVTLRARFANPRSLLLPGMYVRAHIVQQTVADAYLVPQQAVARDDDGAPTVLVAARGGMATLRRVTADRTQGDRWVVTRGLQPGDRVIVEGLGNIKPGQKINAVPAGSPPRGARRGGTRRPAR